MDHLHPGVGPSEASPVYGHGSLLKKKFGRFRKSSIKPFDCLKISGRNNPDFKSFYERSGINLRCGGAVIIGAEIIGLGKNNEAVFINRTSRRMPLTENIGCEEGMGGEADLDSVSCRPAVTGARPSSRRSSRENKIQFQAKAIDFMEAQTNSIRSSQGQNCITETLMKQKNLLSMWTEAYMTAMSEENNIDER